MKRIIGFALVLFIISCSSKPIDKGWDITITGKVNYPQGGKVTIRQFQANGLGEPDSIKVVGGRFEKKMHVAEPGYYQLNFYDQQVFNVILNKTNLDITLDGNNMQGMVQIKGSPEYDLIVKVQTLLHDIQASPLMVSIKDRFNQAAAANNQNAIQSIRAEYMAAVKVGTDSVAALLKRQPSSFGTLDLLQQGVLDADSYPDVFQDAAVKIQKEYPESRLAKDFIRKVDMQKATAVGQVAPEIALPNPKGDTVRLSSLRGKYVLVDFWAKWCGPCRRENPNVVKAYHQFKSKGFEVFGVSLDRTKEDWVQAIAEDGLEWTQVSDLKYFDSQAARTYNINAIPFSILLDKNGVIIAKNLRGAALEEKLNEVLH